MKRRSLIAIGAVVIVGLGVAGVGALNDDGPSKAAPVTSTPSAAENLRPVAPARPVTFTKPAKRADFNGDGYRDLVDPFLNPGQAPNLLTVVYGGPEGLTSGRHQSVGPSVPGVPGNAQVGWTVATADFDRDGYADLAVDTVNARESARDVPIVIFYGSATGLSGRSVVLKSPVGDSVDNLAAGDFDGAGGVDLVVTGKGTSWIFRDITTKPVTSTKIPVTGRTGDKIRRRSVGPAASAWARDPVVADVNGDHRSDLVLIVETPAADLEEGESFWNAELRLGTAKGLSRNAVGFGDDRFSDGPDPLAGDVNGDGRADVIVGGSDGTLVTFLGTTEGLAPGRRIKLPLRGEIQSLAVGDTDGDGNAELAVGGWNMTIAVLPGGENGPVPARARRFDKTTPGLPAAPGNDLRHFGDRVFLTDLNGDEKADLVVGATQEKVPTQDRVIVLPGSDSGVTVKGATTLRRADLK